MSNFFRALVLGLLVGGVAVIACPARATTMIPVNLVETIDSTENAFIGSIVSTEKVETTQGWADRVTFKVIEPVFGDAQAGEEIHWLQYRLSEQVPLPGMPRYSDKYNYLIFLAGKGTNSQFQAPFALGQGAFRIEENPATGEKFAVNEFSNDTLFTDTQLSVVADAMVAEDSKSLAASGKPAMTSEEIEAARLGYEAEMAGSNGGFARVEFLKAAAQAIHSVDKSDTLLIPEEERIAGKPRLIGDFKITIEETPQNPAGDDK